MKVWITKYALTQGIEEIDSEMVRNFKIDNGHLSFYRDDNMLIESYLKKDWCREKGVAIMRAEEMRIRKIKNLEKQIKKLEEMKFE